MNDLITVVGSSEKQKIEKALVACRDSQPLALSGYLPFNAADVLRHVQFWFGQR